MADSDDEECERAHLVPASEGHEKEISPPPSPAAAISRIMTTPPSPTSNKVSSSGGGSLSSRTVNKLALAPSLTPVQGTSSANASSRFLYVNQKLGSLSRRPSLLSDNSARTPKESHTTVKMKRDTVLTIEKDAAPVPPNTPDPAMRVAPPLSSSSVEIEPWQRSSSSSQMTTQAVASDSETVHEDKGSNETLKSPSVAGAYGDYMRNGRMGHAGPRSVGSSAFLKSLWGHRTNQRNIQHHSFFTDTTDVRQMEHALLQLLEDFHSGKLRAFAKDGSMEQMQGIREQQERLARLHFDLGARQELYAPLSDEGLRANQENMRQVMSSLQQLSQSIEKLHLFRQDGD